MARFHPACISFRQFLLHWFLSRKNIRPRAYPVIPCITCPFSPSVCCSSSLTAADDSLLVCPRLSHDLSCLVQIFPLMEAMLFNAFIGRFAAFDNRRFKCRPLSSLHRRLVPPHCDSNQTGRFDSGHCDSNPQIHGRGPHGGPAAGNECTCLPVSLCFVCPFRVHLLFNYYCHL